MSSYEIVINSFRYPGEDVAALSSIDWKVEKGEWNVLCGESGSGKSTLLSLMKPAMSPKGRLEGEIRFHGKSLSELTDLEAATRIGYVMQNPELQIVTPYVWSELAFGLENLGIDKNEIRSRVAEIVAYFGMQSIFHEEVGHLSGGQKQMLNLAAVMVMNPEVLLLDEPTAQLDPIAATEFLHMLHRIHEELGMTIVMSEQRLEEVLGYANHLIVMEQGKIVLNAPPHEVVGSPILRDMEILKGMPVVVRLYQEWAAKHGNIGQCPLSICEGKRWFSSIEKRAPEVASQVAEDSDAKPILSLQRVWFGYDKDTMLLHDFDFTIRKGELHAIIGGNGCGKSTLLGLLSGWYRPLSGHIRKDKALRIAHLPQNVHHLLLSDSVEEELVEECANEEELVQVLSHYELLPYRNRHPRDLSGGEQGRLALAKVMQSKPELLLLDEPTKGMDGSLKERFADWISEYRKNGGTVILVSHDLEFVAANANRVSMMFDGEITASDSPGKIFACNRFYTTVSNRIAGEYAKGVILPREVASIWKNDTSES